MLLKRSVVIVGVSLSVVGVILICVGGIIIPRYLDRRVNDGIASRYVPTNGTSDYRSWLRNDLENSSPEVYAFRFFHINNSDECLYHGATPQVLEKGPFLYQYHRHRIDVEPNDDGSEVSFLNREYFTPIAEYDFMNNDGTVTHLVSKNPDEEYVTLINPVIYAVVFEGVYDPLHTEFFDLCKLARKSVNAGVLCLAALLSFANVTVPDMLEGGGPQYGMFPTRTASHWLGIVEDEAFESRCLEMLRGVRREPDARWGFMYNSSETSVNATRRWCHRERIRFSRADIGRAQTMVTWNGREKLNSVYEFNADHSKLNVLNFEKQFAGWGEELSIIGQYPGFLSGAYTHPHVSCGDELLYFWTGTAARAVEFRCNGTVNVHGVNAYRFVPTYENLTPHEKMYFSPTLGLFNMSQFHQYSPVQVSTPHFYNYTSLYDKYPISGMREPSMKMDNTFVDVEPRSGLVISASERIQLNLLTPNTPWDFDSVGLDYNIRHDTLHPLVIMEKYAQLNDDDAHMLRMLQQVPSIQAALRLWCGVIGCLVLFVGMFLVCGSMENHCAKTLESEQLLLQGERSEQMLDSPVLNAGSQSFAEIDLDADDDRW